jgi:hypothetical protein
MISKNKLTYLSFVLFSFLFACKKAERILPQTYVSTAAEKEAVHECSTDEYLKELLINDPEMRNRMEEIERNVQERLQSRSVTTGSVATIPVVVHVVYNTVDQNLSDAQIQSQIDVLNEDFSRQNTDAVNTPAYFQSFAANTNIQFVLAKRDPNGNPTNGITRTFTSTTAFTTNGYVKYTSYGGINPWDNAQYLNIWVCNLSSMAGYSTVPGASAQTDGVVIDYQCFGRIGTLMSSTQKGRTAVHEIGHWLGLAHLWGPSGTCGDDGVTDTPTQETANYGLPVYPHVSACSPNQYGDMFMSYMDYSNDAAMNMFSVGQSERMNGFLYGYRASLLTSLGGVAPGSVPSEVCNAPSGLSVGSISSSGATLNWVSTGAASYNVRYRPMGSSTWVNTTSASASKTISGLMSSTTYEFQAAAVCSSTSSLFSPSATFTTSAPTAVCNVPAGLFANSIGSKTAVLNWASTGAVSYTVRYKQVTSGTWITLNTSSTSLSVAGLSAFKEYEFQVSGNCSSGASGFSASTVFTTLKNRKNA